MSVGLGVIASIITGGLLGWLARRDPNRLKQLRSAAKPMPLSQRRLIAAASVLPGLILMLGGFWSALMIWVGLSVVTGWLLALRFSGQRSDNRRPVP